jgi:hypothetical protein
VGQALSANGQGRTPIVGLLRAHNYYCIRERAIAEVVRTNSSMWAGRLRPECERIAHAVPGAMASPTWVSLLQTSSGSQVPATWAMLSDVGPLQIDLWASSGYFG